MAIYDISCQNLFLWSEKAFFQAGIKALQVFVNRFQIAPYSRSSCGEAGKGGLLASARTWSKF